jgi:hypothetical protein
VKRPLDTVDVERDVIWLPIHPIGMEIGRVIQPRAVATGVLALTLTVGTPPTTGTAGRAEKVVWWGQRRKSTGVFREPAARPMIETSPRSASNAERPRLAVQA